MTTLTLKTVEMTRRIRDQHYAQLKDKTPAERIAFYREQARQLYLRLHITPPEVPAQAPRQNDK